MNKHDDKGPYRQSYLANGELGDKFYYDKDDTLNDAGVRAFIQKDTFMTKDDVDFLMDMHKICRSNYFEIGNDTLTRDDQAIYDVPFMSDEYRNYLLKIAREHKDEVHKRLDEYLKAFHGFTKEYVEIMKLKDIEKEERYRKVKELIDKYAVLKTK